MYFHNYGVRKAWLDKCLKSPVSKDSWTGNVGNGSKHCFNRNDSTFTIFTDHCEGNSVGKGLSYWHGESEDCLLAHCLPMASILFLREAFYCKVFRCIYLKNKKVFVNYFAYISNLHSFWTFPKKDDPHSLGISETTFSGRRC